jgi:hypothetical protein
MASPRAISERIPLKLSHSPSMKYQLAILTVAMTGFCGLSIPSMAESPTARRVDAPVVKNLAQFRISQSKVSNLVVFPEVGLAIPQPIGFTKATSFYGFEQSSTKSSVMLTKIPGPFAEVTKGFNKSGLATRGISLLSQKNVKIDDRDGLLLNVSQSAYGQKFLKWILVFGDKQSTQIVVATFPEQYAVKISEPLKKVVLGVSYSESSSSVISLPFTVTAVEGLSLVQKVAGMGKVAVFTKDGNLPLISPNDPLFMVAPSLGAVPIADRKSFATRRLSGYPGTEIVAIKSKNEISIDNLSGWEIIANAQDKQTKIPLLLHQIVIFPKEGGYILMVGIVGSKQAEIYSPKFKAMALTYKTTRK